MDRKKRTGIDFSKHEVVVTKEEGLLIHHIRKPGSVVHNIKFINTNDIMAVTGDFGNWIFCREFHPSEKSTVSDGYWLGKLRMSSTQEPAVYDSETASKQVQDIIDYWREDRTEDELSEDYDILEWLDELLESTDDGEGVFIAKLLDCPRGFESEDLPTGRKINRWLECVFDGFDEICNRIEEEHIST